MENLSFRYVKAQALIVVIAIFAAALFAVNKWISTNWGLSFSVFAALGFLFGVINTYLWNVKPCKYMYNVPDFSGRYEGELKYEYRDENCETKTGSLSHIKIVKQNGSSITVRSYTRKSDGTMSSESMSQQVSIIMEADGSYSLIYNYLNEGDHDQKFAPHYGTDTLRLTENDGVKSLVGRYYTERLPFGTRGKIDVTWKSNKLNLEK